MEANTWTPEVFSWIDWPMFQRCCNSLNQRDNQIVKLTHDLLPTNSQILHLALKAWLQNTPMSSMTVTQAERLAIKQQTAIG
eukprot:11378211-Ditylum_brightwellii.AAC.1